MILGLSRGGGPDKLVVDNQRGRRNVATKEQLDYISGKRYEAQKNIDKARDQKGVFKVNAPYLDSLGNQNKHERSTAGRQAKAENVSDFTIHVNEKFAKGIDAIKEVSPELADKILGEGPERAFKPCAPSGQNTQTGSKSMFLPGSVYPSRAIKIDSRGSQKL